MIAIGMPRPRRPLVPREDKKMSALPAYTLNLPKQRETRVGRQLIMPENNARPERQPPDCGQQVIAEARVGHQPDARQGRVPETRGLAAAHRLAYSPRLWK